MMYLCKKDLQCSKLFEKDILYYFTLNIYNWYCFNNECYKY